MYLFETGIGEVFKQRKQETPPAKPPPRARPRQPPKAGKVLRGGDLRQCFVHHGIVDCNLDLRVRFRRSFAEFLSEVETAFRRWMAPPTARKVVKKLHKDLQARHDVGLKQRVLDNDPLVIGVGLHYKRSGAGWRLDDIDDFLHLVRRPIDL